MKHKQEKGLTRIIPSFHIKNENRSSSNRIKKIEIQHKSNKKDKPSECKVISKFLAVERRGLLSKGAQMQLLSGFPKMNSEFKGKKSLVFKEDKKTNNTGQNVSHYSSNDKSLHRKEAIQNYYTKIIQGKLKKAEKILKPELKTNLYESKEPLCDYKESKSSNNRNSIKAKRIHRSQFGNGDEVSKLQNLSYINMGARYELLNANKMFLDFNIRFSVWFKGNK